MGFVKKRKKFIFSNGSVSLMETSMDLSKKTKSLKEDHLTYTFNKKFENFNSNLDTFKAFKQKFISTNNEKNYQ